MDRLACVNVAALPLQILLRTHPAWAGLPVVVVKEDRPSAPVLYANAQARQAGVRSGQRYATALSLARNLQAGVVSQTQVEDAVRALTDRLRRYSPNVEPASAEPGVFWLDTQGLENLYPSLHAWAGAVRADLQSAGMKAAIATGFSRFGVYALAMAHRGLPAGQAGVVVCKDAAEEQARAQKVPLARLHLDPGVRDRLQMLGIATVGDFLRLPDGDIRIRFGAELHALHQLASGHRWAPLSPAPATEVYARTVEFDAPESNAERLVFVLKRLLDGFAPALIRKAEAAAAVFLHMKLDDRATRTACIRPADPTLDIAQLLSLIYLRLNALQLSAGIVTLRVTLDTCPATSDQRRLFQERRRDLDAAHQALARIRAECGERSVVRASIRDAHLPAARFAWKKLMKVPKRPAPRVLPLRPLVRRIYAQPLSLPLGSMRGIPAARLSRGAPGPPKFEAVFGPYVLSGGWWSAGPPGMAGVHREYYFARMSHGELWWIYYDRRRQGYFLQGQVE